MSEKNKTPDEIAADLALKYAEVKKAEAAARKAEAEARKIESEASKSEVEQKIKQKMKKTIFIDSLVQ